MKRALVTGACGLVGSECARLLSERGWDVTGIDNDMRRTFFGDEASTLQEVARLGTLPRYQHRWLDIRDRQGVRELLRELNPAFVIHTAGQPSHDRAAAIPYDDFDVNAVGTLNLLVASRDYCPEAPFCFTSTNKVYGDRPNYIPVSELDTRYEYLDSREGVDEKMDIDQCLHFLDQDFGTDTALEPQPGLDLRQQRVHPENVTGGLDLRNDYNIKVFACALDHFDHILVSVFGFDIVHTEGAGFFAPIERAQRFDHLTTRLNFLVGCDSIFQIEKYHVRIGAESLLDHSLIAAGGR